MTKSNDKNLVSPGGTVALGAAAFVLNFAELVLILVFAPSTDLLILQAFATLEPLPLKEGLLDGTLIICISGSLVAMAAFNIPFLCKQFGESSAHAASIVANIGAIIWLYPLVFLIPEWQGSLTFSGTAFVLGLVGGAVLQLIMGYKRRPALDLQSTATSIQTPSFIQRKTGLDANDHMLDSLEESASDGSTIALPTAVEVKLET